MLNAVQSHLQRVAAAAVDGQWPSIVEVATGRQPLDDQAPRRVYRLIGAPRGSTLYWDQPLLVAAARLAVLTGQAEWQALADDYIRAFLERCVAGSGMFRWGNHCYYGTAEHRVVEFHGGVHELRPITPAWDLFWRVDPARTARYIRAMGERHVYDPATGGFNRHDDAKPGHAFIEAGGILCESLAWLAGKTGDAPLLELALRVARYSFRHRHPATGLVPNEPDHGRWDSRVCTSEIGVWAQSLLRAASATGNDEFQTMAAEALRAYLRYAFDPATGRAWGQLDLATGQAVIPAQEGYWPGRHADPWSTAQWPTHDYPMTVAEAALTLFHQTGEVFFRDGAERLARQAVASAPAHTGLPAYAESDGRVIHLLARLGRELGSADARADAARLAGEALARLYRNGMFQGMDGLGRHEAVDGSGYLLLALLLLETGEEPSLLGFGF